MEGWLCAASCRAVPPTPLTSMSLGAAAMSMAGSDPRAEQLSTAAQKHYEAGEYAKAAEAYRGAMQLAPGCDPPS